MRFGNFVVANGTTEEPNNVHAVVNNSQVAELADAAVMILLEGATPNRITHNYLLNIAGLISSQSSYRFESCPDY
jgi:hypothetical protein